MKLRKNGTQTGFTLIELLVVIGIISLLVSIILPSFNRARELAKQAACKVTLKGLGSAVDVYRNEFKCLPNACMMRSENTTSDLVPIYEALGDYASDKANYRCPADKGPVKDGGDDDSYETDKAKYGSKSYWDVEGTSYYIHPRLIDHSGFLDRMLERHGGQHVWLMTEFDHFHGNAYRVGNRNFVFADGHVGDIVEEDVLDYATESE